MATTGGGMEPRILVTGGTGYLGSALVTDLAKRGYLVRTFDSQEFGNTVGALPGVESIRGDLRDAAAVQASMKDISAICHLGGVVTDSLVDMNPPKAHAVNVVGTENVAWAAVRAEVERFIYVSSSSVYGWAAERFDEVDEWVTPRPKTAYAMQKLQAEHIVEAVYGARCGAYCILRPATMCGPAPRPRLDPLMNVFSKQAYYDRRITVHGGSQYRSNVHVQDAVDVFVMLLEAEAAMIAGGIFNITAGNLTVGDAGHLVADVHEKRYGVRPIVELQNVPDARSYRLASAQLLATFGWRPKLTMEDAINDNFTMFESGRITDPNDSLYFNTRRMAPMMAR